MTLVNFSQEFLHMDVLCLAKYMNYILAGIGSNLFIYNNETLEYHTQIFTGERIHSICIKNNLIALKGGRELAVVQLQKNSDQLDCAIISTVKCSDWIQDVVLLENNLVGLTTAHNIFELWDLKSSNCLKSFCCEEKCILYSCKIIGHSKDNIVIFAGTVFGDVLIWKPSSDKEVPLLKRLKGHEGAVFSVEIHIPDKIICTTSDDRSLKVWRILSNESSVDWGSSEIQLVHTLFGHTARVWRSLIVSNFFITIGEDSKLIIWSRDGRMVKALTLHQGSGIRALCYSDETLLTGGEDGGINMISWKSVTSVAKPTKILSFECSFSVRICFTCDGYVYTRNGGCVMVSSTGEEKTYYNENFESYCLMEVSSKGDYIVLGSIKGYLVVIDVLTNSVLMEGQFLNGRVYSVHLLSSHLLTCGPDGQLDFWKFTEGNMILDAKMVLPPCKERWTTCGVITNEKLIVGDRMGNLHVFNAVTGGDPIQTFRKIHSYLGVTDILTNGSKILSVGRDGTMKTFNQDLSHALTQKLPMEWPWRILPYNKDRLILGFHGVSFMVWSMNYREVIASHECGGGHRSCDFRLNQNTLTFLYVKDKKVFTVDLNLEEIFKIRNGFHSKEINCLKMIPNSKVIVTGSEDTTLRFSRVCGLEIEEIDVMKTHISSIRTIALWTDSQDVQMVSAGGKGQIIAWSFEKSSEQCQELDNHFLKKETHNWKSQVPDFDPDTRIMCACILKSENKFIIATGCSDCCIRIFEFSKSLSSVQAISYTHCILNIEFLHTNWKTLLVTMATDGQVVFWDSSSAHLLESFSLHQSGINSFQFEKLTSDEWILATGGDDNLIQVSLVKVSKEDIKLTKLWSNCTTHSCQITGIKILKNFLLTASIDQRITVWQWSWAGNFQMEFVKQYITAVPDVQGMDAKWFHDDTILVSVYGKGVEFFKVNFSPS